MARSGPCDRAGYRRRHKVAHLFTRATQYRRLATRYDKRVCHYRALWTIAATMLWRPG